MYVRRPSQLKSLIGLLAGISALTAATDGAAAPITVPLDQVRIIAFDAPVKTVFVGNPLIADITVIDPTHVFILGKNFGTTNLIALDAKGHETKNEQVVVGERPGSAVTLQRGAAKTTLNCTSARCEAAPTPGDDTGPYEAVTGQIGRRETLSLKAAGAE